MITITDLKKEGDELIALICDRINADNADIFNNELAKITKENVISKFTIDANDLQYNLPGLADIIFYALKVTDHGQFDPHGLFRASHSHNSTHIRRA